MKNWYKELSDRFAFFPPHVQVLNLVSDLKKAEQQQQFNNFSSINHLYRAMILLDYLVADPKWRRKLNELLRLREVIGSCIVGDTPYATLPQVITTALLLEPAAYRAFGAGSVDSRQSAVNSRQSSVISHQSSVISQQSSVISEWRTVTGAQERFYNQSQPGRNK